MNLDLRPASVTDILDRTFRIYRANFVEFIKLAALFHVPIALLNLLINFPYLNQIVQPGAATRTNTLRTGLGSGIWATALLTLIEFVIVNGTVTYMTSEIHLGRHVTAWQGIQAAKGRFLSLTGGLILVYIALIVLGVAFIVFIAACNFLA